MFATAALIVAGDAAFYDENGYIYILGRMRDMIRENGVLVPPLTVEKQLKSHPGIDDCAIVLRRNRSAKDLPTAFVVKNSQHLHLCPTEIRQFAAGKLPDFQELKGGIFFVNNIPRSVTGNVLRQKLSQKRMMMKEATTQLPTSTPKSSCRKHCHCPNSGTATIACSSITANSDKPCTTHVDNVKNNDKPLQ